MPRVSPRKLDPQLESLILEILYNLVGKLDSKNSKTTILALLTPEERLMLGKRIAALLLLKAGYTYTKLNQILKIVPATTIQIKNRVRANQKTFRDLTALLEALPETQEFYKTAKEIHS